MDQPPITFGNVYIGPGATGVVGVNQFGSGNGTPETDLKSCTEAFYITDPEVDRDELINFKGERTDGTCQWIRDDEMYKTWLANERSQFLWISGGPGQGKTMLSIFLTDQLGQSVSSATQVLFYFCSYLKEEQSTADAIIRTLLYQIFKRKPALAQHALDRMETEKRRRDTLKSRETLWRILLKVLDDPSLGPVVCLLDGLDECKDDSVTWLVTNLRAFFGISGRAARQTPNIFKMVVLSRKIVGLLGFPRLDLESKGYEITSDVLQVVKVKIREHPGYLETDKAFWDEVTSMIQARCNGTFLWAGLVLKEILGKETQTEMLQVLREVPEGLDAIYARILSKIPSRWRDDVVRLVRWVATAVTSLSVSQLAQAWYPERGESDAQCQIIRDLVTMSGSLLQTRASFWYNGKRLFLIHSSVEDFFIRSSADDSHNTASNPFLIEAQAVHFEMAEVCLRSINSTIPAQSTTDLFRKMLDSVPSALCVEGNSVPDAWGFEGNCMKTCGYSDLWITYAVDCWFDHAKSCGEAAEGLLDFDLLFFQDISPVRDAWWCFLRRPRNELSARSENEKICTYLIETTTTARINLLITLAFLGLTAMIPTLLKRMQHHDKDYINYMPGNRTALHAATLAGTEDTVLLLLAEGACVTGGYPGSGGALVAAFETQHYGIAKALFKSVCNHSNDSFLYDEEKVPSSLRQQLLFHAAGADDVRFLELLYDSGMRAVPLTQKIVLNAARKASLPVLQFLLDHDFDISTKSEAGWTCLHLAARRIDKHAFGVVKALLDHGAIVNEPGPHGLTALHLAAQGNGSTIPALLSYGADIKAVTVQSALPISMALCVSDFENAQKLLDDSKSTSLSRQWLSSEFFRLNLSMATDTPEVFGSGFSKDNMCIIQYRDLHLDGEQKKLCETFLRLGADINHKSLEGSTSLDLFRRPLWAYQLDCVKLMMQHNARCTLDKDTEEIQKVLAQRFQDGVSSNAWDDTIARLILNRGDGSSRHDPRDFDDSCPGVMRSSTHLHHPKPGSAKTSVFAVFLPQPLLC